MRKRCRLLAVVVVVVMISWPVAQGAETPPDGTIVEQTRCAPDAGTYEQYLSGARAGAQPHAAGLLTRAEFEQRRAYKGFECYRIRYVSDGLKVVGYIWKPAHAPGTKMPLVIFNRGGNRERSKLTPWMAGGFYDFVSAGFVVIASQYRGVDGGEGTEEYGGSDVHDVLSLFPLARGLGYIDMENVFMCGNSRGGMMTYLALKAGAPVRAAAVTSGVANVEGNAADHPELIETVYRQLIPDFELRREEAMRERSAVYWADRVNVPLLLMHGSADQQVSSARTLELAQKLQALGKTYELVIYAGDDHGLSRNRADRDRQVLAWFRRHMSPAAAP
jgi:dipeptidyl aminopeptidase/acylaminoacyl peptidase